MTQKVVLSILTLTHSLCDVLFLWDINSFFAFSLIEKAWSFLTSELNWVSCSSVRADSTVWFISLSVVQSDILSHTSSVLSAVAVFLCRILRKLILLVMWCTHQGQSVVLWVIFLLTSYMTSQVRALLTLWVLVSQIVFWQQSLQVLWPVSQGSWLAQCTVVLRIVSSCECIFIA